MWDAGFSHCLDTTAYNQYKQFVKWSKDQKSGALYKGEASCQMFGVCWTHYNRAWILSACITAPVVMCWKLWMHLWFSAKLWIYLWCSAKLWMYLWCSAELWMYLWCSAKLRMYLWCSAKWLRLERNDSVVIVLAALLVTLLVSLLAALFGGTFWRAVLKIITALWSNLWSRRETVAEMKGYQIWCEVDRAS